MDLAILADGVNRTYCVVVVHAGEPFLSLGELDGNPSPRSASGIGHWWLSEFRGPILATRFVRPIQILVMYNLVAKIDERNMSRFCSS